MCRQGPQARSTVGALSGAARLLLPDPRQLDRRHPRTSATTSTPRRRLLAIIGASGGLTGEVGSGDGDATRRPCPWC